MSPALRDKAVVSLDLFPSRDASSYSVVPTLTTKLFTSKSSPLISRSRADPHPHLWPGKTTKDCSLISFFAVRPTRDLSGPTEVCWKVPPSGTSDDLLLRQKETLGGF